MKEVSWSQTTSRQNYKNYFQKLCNRRAWLTQAGHLDCVWTTEQTASLGRGTSEVPQDPAEPVPQLRAEKQEERKGCIFI